MAPWCTSRPCNQRDFYLKHWMEALLWQASVQSKQRLAGLLPQTRGGKAAPRSTLMENTHWSWPFLTTTWNQGHESSTTQIKGLPGGTVGKNLLANVGDTRDTGSIPGLGRSPGEGKGNPLQYSCVGNPVDRGAWWFTVHGAAKELDSATEHSCTHPNKHRTHLCV